MIKILYYVAPSEKETELQWLREQKIYPSCQETFDWKKGVPVIGFGVIVDTESALAIKLRHKLEIQINYNKR